MKRSEFKEKQEACRTRCQRFVWVVLIPFAAIAAAIPGLPADDSARLPFTPRIVFSLAGVIIGIALTVWIGVRNRRLQRAYEQRCPHCGKAYAGLNGMIVLASGRCGYCGQQIIDDDA